MPTYYDLANISVSRPCRLVLRHNAHLQIGVDMDFGDKLSDKLVELWKMGLLYPAHNPKIQGCKKVLEHTKINGMRLLPMVSLLLRKNEKKAGRLISLE